MGELGSTSTSMSRIARTHQPEPFDLKDVTIFTAEILIHKIPRACFKNIIKQEDGDHVAHTREPLTLLAQCSSRELPL